jgi:DHA1 family bicyclomycin/chloramphenicol resistance-like MFS transporter
MFPPADAQRVMSQVTIYFGVAPGGGADGRRLPPGACRLALDLLVPDRRRRRPLRRHLAAAAGDAARHPSPAVQRRNLLRGYWELGSNPRFLMLALASGIPFNGMFLYVLSAPVFLGEHLHLEPGEFFWFFVLSIAGIMSGAFLSGRMAGKVKTSHQIRYGFVIMAAVSLANLALNLDVRAAGLVGAAADRLYSFGWAMMVPVVTLLVLDLVPGAARHGVLAAGLRRQRRQRRGRRRGAPLVMHSTIALAATSLAMMIVGVVAWLLVKPHLRLPALAPQSAS